MTKTVWAFPNAVGNRTVIRGLAGTVMERMPVEYEWDGDPSVHGWLVDPDQMPDLEAALMESQGISVRESKNPLRVWTPPKEPDMAEEEARRKTDEFKQTAQAWVGVTAQASNRLTTLGKELIERKAWLGLGYATMQAYCEAELDGLHLPADARREVVAEAVLSGLSVRAAAMIAGTSERTARRDLDLADSGAARAAPQLERNTMGMGADGKTYPRRQQREDGPPPTPRNQRALVGNIVDMGSRRRFTEVPSDLDVSDDPDWSCLEATLRLMEDWLAPEHLLRSLASRVQSQMQRLAAGEER